MSDIPFDEYPEDSDWVPNGDPTWDSLSSEPPAPAAVVNHLEVTENDVLTTLRAVLASQDGATPESALELFTFVASGAAAALEILGSGWESTYRAVFECLRAECANRSGGQLDLSNLKLAALYDSDVRDELARIAAARMSLDTVTLSDPTASWSALGERIQRMRASRSALRYHSSLKSQRTVAELLEAYKRIEPPTNRKGAVRYGDLLTARYVHQLAEQAMAGRAPVRLSSGFPMLDLANSGSGDVTGFIALGEGAVIAAGTGSGKSSFTYTLVPALTQDLVNYGFNHGRVLFLHTEEESEDKLKAMGFLPGQKFHHLADNLIIVKVGTSRARIVETIYDVVIEAHRLAGETGRPITDFLPYVLVLDYIQSIMEVGETPAVSGLMTAELILRGVQGWDPEEMAKFGGVSFREYAGFAWPDGMTQHRVATVTFAQLVKSTPGGLNYKPGVRDNVLSDFTLEDTRENPGWLQKDATGQIIGRWGWEVQEGDLRILGKNDIAGSAQISRNATTIIFLHRSRVQNNPAVKDERGELHLVDRRARLIIDKARNGVQLPFVPLDFDVDAIGYRARFYDRLAEAALADGRLEADACYSEPGDPILPVRSSLSPLAGWSY